MSNKAIHCGNTTDDFEKLKHLCKFEAEKLTANIVFSEEDIVKIPFWTNDIPELICIGHFYKNEKGVVTFDLDFSQTTL